MTYSFLVLVFVKSEILSFAGNQESIMDYIEIRNTTW